MLIKSVPNKDEYHCYYKTFSRKCSFQIVKKIIKKKKIFSVIMVKLGKTEVAKEKFYAVKKYIRNSGANVDNIIISKSVKTKLNSKYMIEYLDKVIIPKVLIMPKMIGYVKTFKVEDKINKLMSLFIDDEKLLEKYKAIWTKIEGLKNFNLNAFLALDDRYIKTIIRAYVDTNYTNFAGLSVPEDDIECESFIVKYI